MIEEDSTKFLLRRMGELNKDGALDRKFEQERFEREALTITKRNERGLSDWGIGYPLEEDGRYSMIVPQLQDWKMLQEKYLKDKPLLFDNQQIWWAWNPKDCCWQPTDETSILLNFDQSITLSDQHNSIQPLTKNIILEALKRASRKNYDEIKPIEKTWVVFKDTIVDLSQSLAFPNNPKYFATNVIPQNVLNLQSTETPVIDRLFREWVGNKYVPTLYEIIAYSMLSDYPIHRLFCLIGSGRNGKSTFINLLLNFIGNPNSTSVELETLTNNPFTSSKLYKKLICLVGETNFNLLRNTEIIKKLTGQDPIPAQFKHKGLFDFKNFAKIIIATNSLPQSLDKTGGFYSRWQIIDFPNRFSEVKDVLADISEQEYENLARKCILILQKLLVTRKFTNEGTLEQRMQIYEDKANPLQKFIREYYDYNSQEYVIGFEFYNLFSYFLKNNGSRALSRIIVTQMLREEGIEPKKERVDFKGEEKQWVVYWGLKLKNKNQEGLNKYINTTENNKEKVGDINAGLQES